MPASMENNTHFDIIVIGSGPGGYRAAVLASLRGARVAIIEQAEWGGTCLNRGCVPKKDWHHSAQLIAASQRFASRGLHGTLTGDLNQAWQHQHEMVGRIRQSYADYMKRLGIKNFHGRGRLSSDTTVEVTPAEGESYPLSAKHIILATGSRPRLPTWYHPGLTRVLTTDQLFDLPPPEGDRVGLVGTGVIGAELAFILRMFGKRLHWLGRGRPLSRSGFSPQALAAFHTALSLHDIAPSNTAVQTVTQQYNQLQICMDDGSEHRVDWLCLAVGRLPNTASLGLEPLGIACDNQGFIITSERLQTSSPPIYAIGDCSNRAMTANHALHDATAVVNTLFGTPHVRDNLRVPVAIHSAIELARIGLDEDGAIDAGFEPAIGFSAFSTSPRALGQDAEEGFVRLLADMDSGQLLGGEIIGQDAGELIHLLAICPDSRQTLQWLAEASYNHPSRSEELLNAVETMRKQWKMADGC